MDDRLSVSILPTTLTVTHVSTMYIVNPTDDAANLHSQRIDRPLTNDAGQIGNSRKILVMGRTSNELERVHLLVIELERPTFGFDRSNIKI